MKKKLAIFASLVLILSVAAAGTYAYLTAQGTAHNIITAGNVSITLRDETKSGQTESGEAVWEDFNQIYPAGASVMPGMTVDKRVYVENAGKNPCYVRVKLTPSAAGKDGTVLETDGQFELDLENYADYWRMDNEGFYRYNELLQPGEKTEMLISSVTFDTRMGNAYMNSRFDILVNAQAVQSQNNAYDAGGNGILDVTGWPESTPAASESPETTEPVVSGPPETAEPVVSESPTPAESPETA